MKRPTRRGMSFQLRVFLAAAGLAAAGLAAAGSAEGNYLDQSGQPQELTGPGYTVVDFAAAWCEPCYKALPRLQDLASEHPSVRFLVVSVDEEKEGRDQLIRDLEIQLPVIWDEKHTLVEQFHPKGFPATYVLDSAGQVVYEHIGYNPKKWQKLVDFLQQIQTPSGL